MVMQLKLIVVVVGLSLDPIDRNPFGRLMKFSSLSMHCLLEISAKHCLYWLGLNTALLLLIRVKHRFETG